MIDLPILGDAPSGDGAPRHAPAATPTYWRSSEHAQRPADVAAVHGSEFMADALAEPSHANRRQFLQMAGAGVALAGLTGCRRPAEKILPYTRKPQDVIEGIAQYYATAMPFRGSAYPVVAKSSVGRPTKLEGNPEHPYGAGGGSDEPRAGVDPQPLRPRPQPPHRGADGAGRHVAGLRDVRGHPHGAAHRSRRALEQRHHGAPAHGPRRALPRPALGNVPPRGRRRLRRGHPCRLRPRAAPALRLLAGRRDRVLRRRLPRRRGREPGHERPHVRAGPQPGSRRDEPLLRGGEHVHHHRWAGRPPPAR